MTLPAGVTSISYTGKANLDGIKSPKTVVLGLANHAARRNSFTEFFHMGKHHATKDLISESELFLKAAASHVFPGDSLYLVYVVTSAEMGKTSNIKLGNDRLSTIGKEAEAEWASKLQGYLPSGINVATTVIRAPYQAEGLVAVAALQNADLIVASENTVFNTDRDYLLKHSPVPVSIINSATGACQRYNGTGALGLPNSVENAKALKASGHEVNDLDHGWTSSVQYWNKGVADEQDPHVHDDVHWDQTHAKQIVEENSFNR
jgi:hypothetical protein